MTNRINHKAQAPKPALVGMGSSAFNMPQAYRAEQARDGGTVL